MDVEVGEILSESVALSWQPPEDDGGSPITGYIIEKRDASRTMWTNVDRVDKNTLKLVVSKLIEGNSYFLRVRAENKAGLGEPQAIAKPVIPKNPYGKGK